MASSSSSSLTEEREEEGASWTQRRRGRRGNEAKAEALSEALKKRGSISSEEVAKAFARVDRSAFVPWSLEHCAWDDAPLRAWDEEADCVVHLSAPSIYATALEALDLGQKGEGAASFLNIGSGAGYLSALAATILGPRSVHHCVEISAPLAARCRATFAELSRGDEAWSESDESDESSFARVPELRHATVHVASCFELALETSMKFDRIYVGAGARASDARFLSKLLKPGGVIVGPFERDGLERDVDRAPRAQALLRATRSASTADDHSCFEVDELMAVQFAPLTRRAFSADGSSLVDSDFARAATDPKLRSLALRGPTWGADDRELFAPCFLEAVDDLRAAVSDASRRDSLARLPWHVWEDQIWPLLAHDDITRLPKTLKRRGDNEPDADPKRRFTHSDRRLAGATAAAARRSFAIARAFARWTLAIWLVAVPTVRDDHA